MLVGTIFEIASPESVKVVANKSSLVSGGYKVEVGARASGPAKVKWSFGNWL